MPGIYLKTNYPADDLASNTSTCQSESTEASQTVGDDQKDLVEEVMADNLDLMLEIILKVREDEEFAKGIYADCPRLQHLLDQNPDLRPIFEDPNLVRINFEQVYRNAGGVLPEDKPNIYVEKFKNAAAIVVKHPLFKVFRFLLLIRKCYNFIFGGKLTTIRNFFMGAFSSAHPSNLMPSDVSPDNIDGSSLGNQAHEVALNRAADHMSEPDVQEQMKGLLDGDPDHLDDAIEQDPDLKALRASNPLCAELMSDPSTLKILVDPDNLRALGGCPDLIQADFADPDWTPPDMESFHFDDTLDMDADADVDPDVEGDVDVDVDGGNVDGAQQQGNDGGFLDNYERGDPAAANNNAHGGKTSQNKQQKDSSKGGQQGNGGFLSTLGTGLMDYVAAQTIGVSASDFAAGGDTYGLDGLDGQANQIADSAANSANSAVDTTSDFADQAQKANDLASTASAVGTGSSSDDFARRLEGTMDNMEQAQGDKAMSANDGAAAAATGGVLVSGGFSRSTDAEEDADDGDDNADEEIPKENVMRRFGSAISLGLAAFGTATRDYALTAVVGGDLAQEIGGKMDEKKDENVDKGGDNQENTDEM